LPGSNDKNLHPLGLDTMKVHIMDLSTPNLSFDQCPHTTSFYP